MQANNGVENRTEESGLAYSTPCESVIAADLDNDTDVDLYMVCRGAISNRPNLLYENMGNGVRELTY